LELIAPVCHACIGRSAARQRVGLTAPCVALDVQPRLQVGGPRTRGVVEAVFGRLVRCGPGAVSELSHSTATRCPDVWARTPCRTEDTGSRLRGRRRSRGPRGLVDAVQRLLYRLDDYEEVAYHFFDTDYEGRG
jgi:hypothetical protein